MKKKKSEIYAKTPVLVLQSQRNGESNDASVDFHFLLINGRISSRFVWFSLKRLYSRHLHDFMSKL
ncbi:hypothetical protein BLOT_002488 [Blomia tropicalis]|nr:hypothetical protein BLOT_002488 [Blomia tropicalis]